MFENIIEKEICIDEKLEEYISNLIGDVYCGESKEIGDTQIIEIEEQRKIIAKKGILALYEAYINDSITDEPNHLTLMFPNGKMNSFDFERLISYFLLSQFNITHSNVKQAQMAASGRISKAKGAKLLMENRIYKRLKYYNQHLEGIIYNLQEHIETLEETKQPTFDFKSSSITYKKRIKTPLRGK